MTTSQVPEYWEQRSPENENVQLPAELSFELTDALLVELEKYERGKPIGWGATPLDPYDPAIAKQQKQVHEHHHRGFNRRMQQFGYIRKSLRQFIENSSESRIAHRLIKNHESFSHRRQFELSETPDILLPTQDRALKGRASPAELIVVGTHLEIPTYELASLTHPYGQRIKEELEPMRTAVIDGIRFAGGVVFEEPEEEFKIKGASFHDIEGGDAKALRMTRTRTIGQLDQDTTVYERSSFVFQLTDEQFAAVEAIEFDKEWSKKVLQIPGAIEALKEALASNDFKTAVPISTTSFVVNERLVQELLVDTGDNEHLSPYKLRQRLIVRKAEEMAVRRAEQAAEDAEALAANPETSPVKLIANKVLPTGFLWRTGLVDDSDE